MTAAGIEPSTPRDADARIPHAAALALWREAARRSGDDAFGIHTAQAIRAGAFDVLDYATRSSETLEHGLRRLVRYHRLLHDGAVIQLDLEGARGVLTHALPEPSTMLPRQVAEFIVAGWLVVARQATGLDFAPVEVRFRHAAPADMREHRRLFRAPVRFRNAVNGIVLDRATRGAAGQGGRRALRRATPSARDRARGASTATRGQGPDLGRAGRRRGRQLPLDPCSVSGGTPDRRADSSRRRSSRSVPTLRSSKPSVRTSSHAS